MRNSIKSKIYVKPILGFPTYGISPQGQVFKIPSYFEGFCDLKKLQRIKFCTGIYPGYRYVELIIPPTPLFPNESTKISVHRLVALAYIANPHNKPIVNHIDGNKKNNDKSNLEWVTAQENTRHAVKIGLISTGIGSIYGISWSGKRYFFESVFDALDKGFTTHGIYNCIRGKQKEHNGWKWEHAVPTLRDSKIEPSSKKRKIKIQKVHNPKKIRYPDRISSSSSTTFFSKYYKNKSQL